MFPNPFTPIFGGKPDCFFGRKSILARFDRALTVRGSEDRALFITGTRGSGKTALVEQLAIRAEAAGWETYDVSAEAALTSLLRQIQPHDSQSVTTDPSIEVKVLGTGGSLQGRSSTKIATFSTDDIETLFVDACKSAKRGIFVAVDEIQKMPLSDVSRLCAAFQRASKKGYETILVSAGLPYVYERIIQYDGCTFMRRSVHERLGLFDREEAREAFLEAFGAIRGLSISNNALDDLVSCSLGHPYIIQLLGYHLVEYVNGVCKSRSHIISQDEASIVVPVALDAYKNRALRPLVDAMSDGERSYVRAMTRVMGDENSASTGEIAVLLGKSASAVSSSRQSLIDNGIIVPAGWGKVRFAIPYLRTYSWKDQGAERENKLLDIWGI